MTTEQDISEAGAIAEYESKASDDAARFAQILGVIKDGEGISNEDALFFVGLIGSLDNNLRIANDIVESLGESIPDMVKSLAFSVLARVGRTDTKVKRSVLKTCEEHIDTLWTMARIRAVQAATAIGTEEAEAAE
jgi:hypothetical protein